MVSTPLAAASPFVDFQISARSASEALTAVSPDGLRGYNLALPTVFDLYSPAGNMFGVVRVSFDNRLLGGATMEIAEVFPALLYAVTTGNVTVMTFDGEGMYLNQVMTLVFGTLNRGLWFTDVMPFTVEVMEGWALTDPDRSNNFVVSVAEYIDMPPAGTP
ncbi:hypothetical protein [Microbacterium sp. LWH12-1.2]|uniref:hypothetical protein n=1 Tax=Microbacterium sp. LWH12-1.2 TaxID=3135259 RepID=UPI00341AD372